MDQRDWVDACGMRGWRVIVVVSPMLVGFVCWGSSRSGPQSSDADPLQFSKPKTALQRCGPQLSTLVVMASQTVERTERYFDLVRIAADGLAIFELPATTS